MADKASQTGPSTSSTKEAQEETKRECPICVMMREGGCEKQFNDFMDCGIQAEKGEREYSDCIAAFEAMRTCMQANPAAFKEVLDDVEALAQSNTEAPPAPQPAAQK